MLFLEVWGKGGDGGVELAKEVVRLCETENNFQFCYDENLSIEEKLNTIVTKIYRGEGVELVRNCKETGKETDRAWIRQPANLYG